MNEFYHSSILPEAITTSFLALIPKMENPQKVDDFCLICLVSSLYRILAKILALRLKKVLLSLILETNKLLSKIYKSLLVS